MTSRHGDLLYLAEKKPALKETELGSMTTGVKEEAVDLALAARDGKIVRKRDAQL